MVKPGWAAFPFPWFPCRRQRTRTESLDQKRGGDTSLLLSPTLPADVFLRRERNERKTWTRGISGQRNMRDHRNRKLFLHGDGGMVFLKVRLEWLVQTRLRDRQWKKPGELRQNPCRLGRKHESGA